MQYAYMPTPPNVKFNHMKLMCYEHTCDVVYKRKVQNISCGLITYEFQTSELFIWQLKHLSISLSIKQ